MGEVIAQLGMYPFAHVRDAQDQLWAAVRDRLEGAPAGLAHGMELREAWHRPDLLLGQACSWPLLDELAGRVEVVGTFDADVPFAADGHYRSLLVASKPLSVEEWREQPDTVVARNHHDSMSGWASLVAAWGSVPDPSRVVDTGAHVESMRAIAAGRVQLAAIDAVTFQLVAESEPVVAGGVHVVGHGPRIPCLPLVMARELAPRLDEVRTAIAGALADPTLAPAVRRLRIRAFLPFGAPEYEPARALLPGR